MVYRRRIAISAAFALVLHGAALGLAASMPATRPLALGNAPRQEPLVIDLAPPAEQPRRLVDAVAPSEQPPEPTDLIAEQQTRAADLTESEGAEGPQVERVDAFEALGGGPTLAPPPAPAPPEPAEQPPAEPEPDRRERFEEARVRELRAVEPRPEAPRAPEAAPAPEAPPEEAAPPGEEGRSSARVQGDVAPGGLLSFEAQRDEMAPYLADIRRKVEAQWRATLQMRYTGTGPTRAVLDCAIRPDGTLAGVRIVDAGDSPTYAGLCKQAIERAAPFGRFPFEVPAVYRSENLEIRWTFSYL